MLGLMMTSLAEIDEWLDDQVSQRYKDQPLAQDWARISKVAEELGEATSAFILATGQNPRKGEGGDMLLVIDELADTAITAMLAMMHFMKDSALVGATLIDKTRKIQVRMAEHKAKASR